MRFQRFQMRSTPLILLLIFAAMGAILTPHFGESWDELKFYKYAGLALRAYHTWPEQGSIETFGNTYDEYGPAYVMLVALAAKPLQIVFIESDARHYIYFLTFLAGTWAFYKLACRWLSRNTAVFSTLLFFTQPLFFGHAFISPKDMPFLAFFLLALHYGLRLFDSSLPMPFTQAGSRSRRTVISVAILWLAFVVACFLFTEAVHSWISDMVLSAKAGRTNILSLVASDILKAEAGVYIQRYFVLFLRMRSILFLLASILFLFTLRRQVPSFYRSLPAVLLPAFLLGFTTSIRVLGPFAAVFIVHHALRKHGRQAVPYLAAYAILGLITTYLLWPYLWPNPPAHFLESILVMSRYPWNGEVLFDGAFHPSTKLPLSYLPMLLGIQFTEPVWILIVLGLVAAAWRGPRPWELYGVAVIWFLLPLLGFILSHAPLYDNFRQIFFILPPVFMLAGILFEHIRNPRVQITLMILCLLPGVLNAVHLHPYEYIYYNRFIGGAHGAFRRFELDYWGTSYREAAQYVNAVAPEHAAVWVDGPAHLFEAYAREDLRIYSDYEPERADRYAYTVSTSRYNLDLSSYPGSKLLYMIEREDAILAVVKQP